MNFGSHPPVEPDSEADARYQRIRDVAFEKTRNRIGCDKIQRLSVPCERANCACMDAACEIADALVYCNET